MNICIIDNFDSFTFNLLDEFSGEGNKVHVWRNSMPSEEIKERIFATPAPRLLVFSPGPGHPDSAGSMNELISSLAGRVPMFGVCLGMQAMISVFGGTVNKAPLAVHGKARLMTHDGTLLFSGLNERLYVGRYHSLCAIKVPESLRVLAESEGVVMAVAHKEKPIIGIQFHPESILTTEGSRMIKNVIDWAMVSPCQ